MARALASIDAPGRPAHHPLRLKKILIFVGFILTVLAAAAQAGEPGGGDLQRLAALVDYVAADYAGAVQGGKVLAAAEYEEQRGLLRDAAELVRRVPAPRTEAAREALAGEMAALARAVDAKATPEQVAALCRGIRTRLVNDFGLALVPLAPPSWDRAAKLYGDACVRCHGADGRADTEEARRLTPPPVSFHDAERMSRITPQLAYHALTFGVKDTAMASFDTLSAADRWSLAFYVVALRHADDRAAGERALARSRFVPTVTRLAELSDGELEALLGSELAEPGSRAAALDYLRRTVSFAAEPGGTFAAARRLLSEVVNATADRRRAHDLAVAAYLEGVEPHEAALRARDPDLARRIEAGFLALRRTIDGDQGGADSSGRAGQAGDGDAVVREVAQLRLLLDRAEEHEASWGVLFVASLTIALREGLETALLIAALLAFLRKSGREDSARLVHLGWLAAIPAGLVTWFFAGALLRGAGRELVEAVITLLAAVLILGVTHWVLGRVEAQHWVGYLRRKVTAAASGPGTRAWPLWGLAFFAAYREAVEVVLFYRALLLDAGESRLPVALGAVSGLVGIGVVLLVVQRLGRRLNPRPVMLASSVILAALALALVGRGVHALQEGGYIGLSPLGLPELPWLGFYANREGLVAQLGALLAIVLPSLVRPSQPQRA